MRRKTTARAARAEAKAEAARLLVRLLAEHDVTQEELARCCGVATSIVQRWCDRDRPETPSVADIRAMPRPIALGLLRWMSDAQHHVVCEAPTSETPEDLHEHLAATLTECGEASSTVARAIADGHICATEAAAINRETTEAIERLGALREHARRVLGPPPRLVPRQPVPYPERSS